IVKPGATSRPRLAISARLAPLPPSKSRNPALPSALPSPNVNTHLLDFTASTAGLAAATLLAGFGAGGLAGLLLAGLLFTALFNALRAEADGAAFVRAGVEDFDFAAVFLDLATALAMTCKQSARGEGSVRLTPFWAAPRKLRSLSGG